jgi:periplasmic divalent cation tolerance protein
VTEEINEIVVLVTTASREQAQTIAQTVVDLRLAACASILDGVQSVFRWEGKIHSERETLVILKSTRDKYSELETRIRENHSYSVPEIIGLPIVLGAENYLAWVKQETRK